jgi:hypothetical protein
MTASAQLDGRLDWNSTFAALVAANPGPGIPAGTQAWTTDLGEARYNGTVWTAGSGSYTVGVTAHSGGTQAAGVPITTKSTGISTVAASGDSLTLPASSVGATYTVTNYAATNPANIFPSAAGTTTEQINALSANSAFSLAAGKTVQFICYVVGKWVTFPLVP